MTNDSTSRPDGSARLNSVMDAADAAVQVLADEYLAIAARYRRDGFLTDAAQMTRKANRLLGK